MGLRPGVYRHHKGALYRVLLLARRSETEEVVVHQAFCGEKGYWVRPRALFLAPAWVEGRAVLRSQWVGEEP